MRWSRREGGKRRDVFRSYPFLAITLASVISPYNRLQIAIGEERGMARLIMGNLMTFDGFVEGPNRDSAAK